jgi:hypothetical protein
MQTAEHGAACLGLDNDVGEFNMHAAALHSALPPLLYNRPQPASSWSVPPPLTLAPTPRPPCLNSHH